MYGKFFIFIVFLTACFNANADVLDLNTALQETYKNCVGIDDALHDMKVKAGINTAVTAVGTGLGIGATSTGIAKSKTDKILEQKYKEMRELSYSVSPNAEMMDEQDFLNAFNNTMKKTKAPDLSVSVAFDKQQEIDKLDAKSKKLGNWRTGLLAANTVTNVAGTIIAGTNKVDKDLQEQIDDCKASVKNLQDAIIQAKVNGEDVSEATQIETVCREFEYVDVSKINKRATGATVSSAVGIGTGVVGTITSALANSQKIRDDNTDAGMQKEKKLNTASNVLAAGSTVASATATVFNATQIKAIKDVAAVAEKCTGVLR